MAAGGQSVQQVPDDVVRLVVLDEVQYGGENEGDRPVEVERPARFQEDLRGVAQVGFDVVRPALGAAGEQGLRMDQDDRVVVDVDDPGLRGDSWTIWCTFCRVGSPAPTSRN